jgi:hypothetical protein
MKLFTADQVKVGFIGLGNVGRWIAQRLLDHGYPEHRARYGQADTGVTLNLCCWPAYRSIRVAPANSTGPTLRPGLE